VELRYLLLPQPDAAAAAVSFCSFHIDGGRTNITYAAALTMITLSALI
jgi:hypothetical protein